MTQNIESSNLPAAGLPVEGLGPARLFSLRIVRISVYLVVAVASGAGTLGKSQVLSRLFPLPHPLLMTFLCLGVLMPFFWPLALRARVIVTPLAIVGLVLASLVIFPRIERLHQIGRGSDQPDCVIVAGKSLLTGQWPYRRDLLWSHNPMSCGPGWVALQAPLVRTFGYQYNVLFIWGLGLVALWNWLGWKRFAGAISVMVLSPGLWLAAANGTDFLTFGICIAVLAVAVQNRKLPSAIQILLTALLIQFRFPTLFVPIFMEKRRLLPILTVVIAALCWVGFTVWNPQSFVMEGPLWVLHAFTHFGFLQFTPVVAALELTLLIVISLAFCILVSRYFSGPGATLVYLMLISFIPAFLDFMNKVKAGNGFLYALEYWDGGMWIVACLPLVSLLLVLGEELEVNALFSPSE